MKGLEDDARREFEQLGATLEALHRKNKHKYIGDSPAVHLDLLPRAVPGGWRNQDGDHLQDTFSTTEDALAARVGPVNLPSDITRLMQSTTISQAKAEPLLDFGDSVIL